MESPPVDGSGRIELPPTRTPEETLANVRLVQRRYGVMDGPWYRRHHPKRQGVLTGQFGIVIAASDQQQALAQWYDEGPAYYKQLYTQVTEIRDREPWMPPLPPRGAGSIK